MKSGTQLITEERERQISVEGWTPSHDDSHKREELTAAAAYYTMPAPIRDLFPGLWPWDDVDFKSSPDNRVRELVKAGALIAAEIDRLNRANGAS